MTILQLKYVIAIANSKSFREAASRLFVSQPALSSTIRELEEELNIQLSGLGQTDTLICTLEKLYIQFFLEFSYRRGQGRL